MIRHAASLLCLLALAAAPAVQAQSNNVPAEVYSFDEAADFSKQIERELAARGAFVALVFRTGRDREDLPDGVRYTHGAFWIYTEIPTYDGGTHYGYAVYNLYHERDDVRRSYLHQDFPLDFTLGDATGQVGIIIPYPDLQDRILDVMASSAYYSLHQPEYSLISNPLDPRYQNCNEYILDIVSAAAWETTHREQIKVNIVEYFQPAILRIGVMERLFGGWFDRRVRFEDQPSDRIETTTFQSIAEFLYAYDQVQEIFELNSIHQRAEHRTR